MNILSKVITACLISCSWQNGLATDRQHEGESEGDPSFAVLTSPQAVAPDETGKRQDGKRRHEEIEEAEESLSTVVQSSQKKPRRCNEIGEEWELLKFFGEGKNDLPEEICFNILNHINNKDNAHLNYLWNFMQTGKAQKEIVEIFCKARMGEDEPLVSSGPTPWFTSYAFRQIWMLALPQLCLGLKTISKYVFADFSLTMKALATSTAPFRSFGNHHHSPGRLSSVASLCAYL